MSANPVLKEFPLEAVEEIDVSAKDWIQEQSNKEMNRIVNAGSKVSPLKISNCGIVVNFDYKRPRAINRVELDTECDLSKVQQIMVSPPTPYPNKDNFNYVNLILVTDQQPIPFLAPYLYKTNLKVTQPEREEGGRKYPSKEITLKNDLREYLLINKKGGILQRQYQKSFFGQSKSATRPKKLAIFDFDSTLFFSPLLSPTIWHPNLIRVATTESVYGPGWWRDIRSLDLGPFDEMEKKAWDGFWNEEVVQQARHCINDEDTMTIVLTGRRYHPFHLIVPAMLEAKGLQFDMIGLRPDPEHVSDNQWEVKQGQHYITYNLTRSVFRSTMHFKTCFVLNIIHNVPSIEKVTMWDDRIHHVHNFREYLEVLKGAGTINSGYVIHVPGIRPKYNPQWEINVIRHIIETHNKALVEHVQEGTNTGKVQRQLPWPSIIEKEDPLGSSSEMPLKLTPLPAATVVKFSAESREKLCEAYKPYFIQQLKVNGRSKWKDRGGEQPQLFGDYVYLSQKVIPSDNIAVGSVGSEVGVTIKAYSKSPHLPCLVLKVAIDGHSENDYLLPVYYKPSEYYDIFKIRNATWTPVKNEKKLPTHFKGKIDYVYRLGVVEKTTEKRLHSSDVQSNTEELEPKRTRL
ncbi:hypothetical protein [Parasitella parasitica]|uniref:Swiss Army Knife RNA repair protein HAD domain-containing protein n=1 Tax=Parasitella parasitica TaxID=35722 RepID=A0A0B7N6N1_9FUNG|nr:hypothetical protein [Parasitella parasitica]